MTPRRKIDRPRRAVAYIRVSSQQQADSGLSLEHQAGKVRAAATLHDMELVDVITDAAESAASLDRPGVARVLEMVKGKQVDAVIVTKLDRLTRSVRDLADVLDLLHRRNVALVSVSESLDTSTAAGRMVVNLLGVVGQWEREAIAERTRDALAAKRGRGERAGNLAYGWQLAPRPANLDPRAPWTTLEPNPAENDLILFAAECRFELGSTWQDTADALNREGYTTRTGTPWTLHGIRSALQTWQRHREHQAQA